MTEDTASGLTNLDRLRLFIVAGGAEDEPENTPPDTSGESGPQNEEQGTPAEPAEGSEASDINWQERYVEAQSWGTKASQEAAALRQVIDLARQGDPEAREYLGWESAEDDTGDVDDEFADDTDRLDRIEQALAEREEAEFEAEREQELEAAANRFYTAEFERLDPDQEWPEEYRKLVVAVGDEHPDEDGLPQLDKAHEAIQAQFEADFKKRVKSKRAPQAPSGASPTHTPDLDDKEQRRDYFAQRIAQMAEGDPV
jgi:hypothetical protein